jgi:hypothetical protein
MHTTHSGPEMAHDARYFKTPVTPEEAFQAIGRLRKEARDEIDRLIRFLDATEPDPDFEPNLAGSNSGFVPALDDAEADSVDDEPTLGATEALNQDEAGWRDPIFYGCADLELEEGDLA